MKCTNVNRTTFLLQSKNKVLSDFSEGAEIWREVWISQLTDASFHRPPSVYPAKFLFHMTDLQFQFVLKPTYYTKTLR